MVVGLFDFCKKGVILKENLAHCRNYKKICSKSFGIFAIRKREACKKRKNYLNGEAIDISALVAADL